MNLIHLHFLEKDSLGEGAKVRRFEKVISHY